MERLREEALAGPGLALEEHRREPTAVGRVLEQPGRPLPESPSCAGESPSSAASEPMGGGILRPFDPLPRTGATRGSPTQIGGSPTARRWIGSPTVIVTS